MIVIGVDIGGTSIKGAAIRDNGEILDRFSLPMEKYATGEESIGKMCDVINEFMKKHQYDEPISGIGMGVPGIHDKEKGIVKSSPNMPKWIDFPIKDLVEKRTGLPAKILNDASAAALGEAVYGSGKEYENLIMITLGTGVGGGIVLNKKLYDGLGGTGAQLGHNLIELGGRPCNCGRKGCLEAYASATALIKETLKAMEAHPESKMHEIAEKYGKVDARVAFDADRMGDPEGHRLVQEYVMYLGEGLMDYCNIFRPDVFVLSGGVANEGDYLITRLISYMEERHFGFLGSPKIPIKQASLGYDSGKIGAAALFFLK